MASTVGDLAGSLATVAATLEAGMNLTEAIPHSQGGAEGDSAGEGEDAEDGDDSDGERDWVTHPSPVEPTDDDYIFDVSGSGLPGTDEEGGDVEEELGEVDGAGAEGGVDGVVDIDGSRLPIVSEANHVD